MLAFRYPLATALTISASLAQIGEFSFILAELGVGLQLLPEQGRDLILAGAILSILINPLAFAAIDRLRPRLDRPAAAEAGPVEPTGAADLPPTPTRLSGHTILVGYGRVGSLVGKALKAEGLPYLVIEDADKAVARLREERVETIVGNAADAETFDMANPAGAARLILAVPNAFEAGQVAMRARAANPGLRIIARAHSDAEVEHLSGLGADVVIMGEREIARGIVEEVMKENGQPEARA